MIKRRPESLLERFNRNAAHLGMSAITLAELMHGAEKSSDPPRSLAVVENFCSRLEVQAYGAAAARLRASFWACWVKRTLQLTSPADH